ncbi:MAG: DUF4157 domain-containing protein [Bacteroidota bacterium]
MKNILKRNRRHRNPSQEDKQGENSLPISEQPVQTKLVMGQAGDKYEQEADAMANKVVNSSQASPQLQKKEEIPIQRMGEEEEAVQTMEEEEPVQAIEEEEPVQTMEEEAVQTIEEEEAVQTMEEEEPVQTKSAMDGTTPQEELETDNPAMTKREGASSTSNSGIPPKGLANKLKKAKGKGKPLAKSLKKEMEAAIGANFEEVRIHTDEESAAMNQELKAQAFAHGKDIFFNEGKFNPESTKGKHLLAHELIHIIQQNPSIQKDKGGTKP